MRQAIPNGGNQRGKIMNVKITPEERAVLRRLGQKSRKETEKRLGKDYNPAIDSTEASAASAASPNLSDGPSTPSLKRMVLT
jgi:hypothetical protein